MNIIVALSAFTLTMVVLSTLVVTIVELVHSARGMRKRHLAYLVGAVFDEFLWPHFGDKLSREDFFARPGVGVPEDEVPIEPQAWIERQLKSMASWSVYKLPVPKLGMVLAFPSGWWVLATAVIAALCIYDYLILALLLGVALAYFVDGAKEPDRFNYPGLPMDEPERRDKLRKLQRRGALMAKAQNQQSGKEKAELESLQGDSSLDDETLVLDYRMLVKRWQFILQMIRISPSVTANPSASRSAFVTKLSPTDFAARLARTEFGAAIRDAAAEELEAVLQETARRFDAIGKGTTETFRARSRRWSIITAFVLAIVANVDAITLFDTYYRNPTLAAQVERTYATRLHGLERRLTQERSAELLSPEQQKKRETEIRKLEGQIDDMTANLRREIQGLSDLGVPIGWARFPYCISGSVEGLDAACRRVARSQLDKLKDKEGVKARLVWPLEVAKLGRSASSAPPLGFRDYLVAYGPEQGGEAKASRMVAHWYAATLWIYTRNDNGLLRWLLGVALGGALIGLGGPFWFDVYRRISAVTSIAQALGGIAKPAPVSGSAATRTPPEQKSRDPEAQHQPKDVRDAFVTALQAQDALDRAREGDLILAAELSDERPKDSMD